MKFTAKCTRSELDLLATLIPAFAPIVPHLKPITDGKETGNWGLVNPEGEPGRVEWEIEVTPDP